jgi:hypothetical protein
VRARVHGQVANGPKRGELIEAAVEVAAMRIPTKSPGHSEMMSPGIPT